MVKQECPEGQEDTAVLIAGPTASGKSSLAIEVARRWNGCVINADSMQLYRELSIITARPSAEEEASVPHRFYGALPAAQAFSTGDWLRHMAREIEACRAQGQVPVLVGGTGLYFKALTEGFAELPEIDADIRSACRTLAARGGIEAVRAALAEHDPEAAASLQDVQRLTRALEVVRATGRCLSDWQRQAQTAPLVNLKKTVPVVLAPPRPWLHARIALRAGLMLEEAGVEEVRALLAQGLSPDLPAMRAIGVKEIAALLSGECDREEALRRLTVATRQYAKRQETWFRNQMPHWHRFDPSLETSSDIMQTLEKQHGERLGICFTGM